MLERFALTNIANSYDNVKILHAKYCSIISEGEDHQGYGKIKEKKGPLRPIMKEDLGSGSFFYLFFLLFTLLAEHQEHKPIDNKSSKKSSTKNPG